MWEEKQLPLKVTVQRLDRTVIKIPQTQRVLEIKITTVFN